MTPEQEENVKVWVDALRSGRYKQAKLTLYSGPIDNGYCCLGVAGRAVCGFTDEDFFSKSFGANPYRLIKKSLGLDSPYGEYVGGILSQHNDNDGWDFNEIADLIESRPEGLFVE